MIDEFLFNRLGNCTNPFQGNRKKVLCVCSAGLLRSPTAAYVLSNEPYGFNTRAAGIFPEFALIPVDRVLLKWADEIVCMDTHQTQKINSMLEEPKPVFNLNIPDRFEFRSQELERLIAEAYEKETNG